MYLQPQFYSILFNRISVFGGGDHSSSKERIKASKHSGLLKCINFTESKSVCVRVNITMSVQYSTGHVKPKNLPSLV